MLKANIIRHSNSTWSFPVVLVGKSDKTKRLCVNYKRLNDITINDPFPIPLLGDILDRVGSSLWLSDLDLKPGYWQIEMHPDDIQKTAFTTQDGHYEFLRLPFGLKNAPNDFCRIMAQILGHLKFVEIYFDNITIHSQDFHSHKII
jgi:hypothetical protein